VLVIDDRNEGLASSDEVVNHRVPKWQLLGAACTPETRQLMWHDSDDDQL